MSRRFRSAFINNRRITGGLFRTNDKWRIHPVLCDLDRSGKD